MSWHCSQALVEGCLAVDCSAGERSAQSKSSPTADECSCKDKTAECSIHSRYGVTCEHLTELPGGEKWMSSLRASPVNRSAKRANSEGPTTRETCGRQRHEYLAKYDRNTHCWRTCQRSLLADTLEPFSETWPKSGLMRDGECFRQPDAELPISGKGCSLLPTPAASPPGWKNIEVVDKHGNPPSHPFQRFYEKTTGRLVQKGLEQVVTMFPTPTSRDYRSPHANNSKAFQERCKRSKGVNLVEFIQRTNHGTGGKLNPMWVEWLMGWPIGWTDLKPLATGRFQAWLSAHGES